MSLERNIQELHQAVTMLTKSIDLQTATIAEATAELLQAMQNRQTSTVKVEAAAAEVEKAVKKVRAKKEEVEKEEELTDDEIKASPIYRTIQDKMTLHYGAALAANGGDQQSAREDTLKILKTYADDGKVVSLVRVLLEDEEAGAEVMNELLGVYDTAIAALQDVDEEDEGEEEQTYTADDVKAALRAYAKIEGRPAAIMKLQQLTNGKSEVKDIPEDQYAAVIAGLKADM